MSDLTFILSYETVSPAVVCNVINDATDHELWAIFRDINEDSFNLRVFNPFEGKEISDDDFEWVMNYLATFFEKK